MSRGNPCVFMFGEPEDQSIRTALRSELHVGVGSDNGLLKDPIFTFYENVAEADLVIAYPNAHPVHLLSLIAEGEVGHPLMLQKPVQATATGKQDYPLKPIVFFGNEADWAPFKAQFAGMKHGGLLRDGFDRIVHYTDSVSGLIDYVDKTLIREIPTTRLHYYKYNKQPSDISVLRNPDAGIPSDITIAFFCSASTKDPAHHAHAREAAKMLADRGWNALDGGGSGLMETLNRACKELGVYTYGVSVDPSGAPLLFFERKGSGRPEHVDHYIESKGMIPRIETYHGHSHASIAYDGGVGSAQEVLMTAQLLAQNHPVMSYETVDGNVVQKPLYIMDGSRIWGEVLKELERRPEFRDLRAQIQARGSFREIEQELGEYFREHRPISRSERERHSPRARYHDVPLPRVDISSTFPDLVQRARELGSNGSAESGRPTTRERGDIQP